jgi:hypothetical protein
MIIENGFLKKAGGLFLIFCLFLFSSYSNECLAKPPYCSDECNYESYCDTSCTNADGQVITCYQWGICDPKSLVKTSIKVDKAYPYPFPDPYGFGLQMLYTIAVGKGFEAVSVTTQYSPDDGQTWYTDEEARSPVYNWDNIHGDIECGSAKYNLMSNHTYTLRATLNYRDTYGSVYHLTSNPVKATVENYNPPVLYNNVGHIPEPDQVNWRNAGLLPSNRSGLLPETPAAAQVIFDVTLMSGTNIDAKIAEALNRARIEWRDHARTSIIYFPPGSYRIKSPIVLGSADSNIIFQGAGVKGPNATILQCNVGKDGTCFQMLGSTGASPIYDLSADIPKGDRLIMASLPLCPSGSDRPDCFSAGNWIHLWEADFPAESGAVVGQITQLESVSPDFRMKDDASKEYLATYGLRIQKIQPVTNIGIENLKIYRVDSSKSSDNQYGSGSNFLLIYAVNCWLRGVESELTSRHHIHISHSSHIEISGCYLHRARYYGGNSYGYGTVLGESSTNCLIENNVFRRLRHAMGIGTGANNNVYTFNYSREQYSTYKVGPWEISYSDSDICLHGRYPYANLFEHNMNEYIEADDEHGKNGPYNAFVRNKVTEDNIELHNAPYSAVLGCEIESSPPVKTHGNTSFSIEGYGKLLYVNNNPVPYENAPWVPHEFKFLKNISILKDVSYFYTTRPYFLSPGYTWPSIGPELENPALKSEFDRKVSQTIPAKGRYDAGKETYISKITVVTP